MQKPDNHSITKFLLLFDILKSRGGRIIPFPHNIIYINQLQIPEPNC
mgnify:CR=1 FL=1